MTCRTLTGETRWWTMAVAREMTRVMHTCGQYVVLDLHLSNFGETTEAMYFMDLKRLNMWKMMWCQTGTLPNSHVYKNNKNSVASWKQSDSQWFVALPSLEKICCALVSPPALVPQWPRSERRSQPCLIPSEPPPAAAAERLASHYDRPPAGERRPESRAC